MSKTHIATFILHSTSLFLLFHYVTNSTFLCCKSVTLNNKKKVGVNSYIYYKNIIDSPICVYGAREDTQHFLMSCTRYTTLRQELVNTVTPVFQPCISKCIHILQNQPQIDTPGFSPAIGLQPGVNKSLGFI